MGCLNKNALIALILLIFTANAFASGAGGGGGGGGGGGTTSSEPSAEETEEPVLSESSDATQPTAEEVSSSLGEAGLGSDQIEMALDVVDKVEVVRSIVVSKKMTGTVQTSVKSSVTLSVKNTSDGLLKDAKIVEVIPKEAVNDASKISSSFSFVIWQKDPVIQFSVGDLQPGQSVEVTYNIPQEITKEVIDSWPASITIAEFQVLNLCAGVTCAPRECNIGRCDSGTGQCVYSPVVDGIQCSVGQCVSGQCRQAAAEEAAAPSRLGIDIPWFAWLFVIVGVIVFILGFYYVRKKPGNPFSYRGK